MLSQIGLQSSRTHSLLLYGPVQGVAKNDTLLQTTIHHCYAHRPCYLNNTDSRILLLPFQGEEHCRPWKLCQWGPVPKCLLTYFHHKFPSSPQRVLLVSSLLYPSLHIFHMNPWHPPPALPPFKPRTATAISASVGTKSSISASCTRKGYRRTSRNIHL